MSKCEHYNSLNSSVLRCCLKVERLLEQVAATATENERLLQVAAAVSWYCHSRDCTTGPKCNYLSAICRFFADVITVLLRHPTAPESAPLKASVAAAAVTAAA